MKKEDIEQFVNNQLTTADYASDFLNLDSLEKVELIIDCENKFNIEIDEDEIEYDWSTDEFIDYLYKKINANL